ncbi:ABC transporter ATP-binding protein [Mesorhizobium qingshengii]|uniref:Amino acid/amide ABC transporter ATP-binding protein 1, HAAT family (TC 3.A.1.4.-) n=1 Tax=Mesorhizobium qingshengii TaxID=1165689 RepID=A0A1G5Z8T3_9HYPH|nr:ABC transporter ATP-binding protein [Mesorhizobium qingshengii]SDA91288.1 amino acid/amide ABC transporter ATP-binding protein 1, HAAT family (TC 3.A.1.4.-) [Mesorhizobium qingshengii]
MKDIVVPQSKAAPPGTGLSIKGISKSFGGLRAVDNCSFDVKRGSITGLIGPNGAGKTTLFSIITGFLSPDCGRITLDDVDVTRLAPHDLFHRGLVRTFQIPHEFSKLSVLENLMVVPANQPGENPITAWLRPGLVREREEQVFQEARNTLAFLGLEKVCDLPAGNLSGGQRKLVELGRAMMSGAGTVLLDEPGAGVNPTLLAQLSQMIMRLNSERGTTFCIIEHNMDMITSLCDTVVVMSSGSVLTQGHMSQIKKDDRVLAAYLGSSAVRALQ